MIIVNGLTNTHKASAIVNAQLFDMNSEFMLHYRGTDAASFIPDMSDVPMGVIMRSILGYQGDIAVKKWYPWNRWTSAIAMTKGTDINLNARLTRSAAQLIETMGHETVHIVDMDSAMSFGHGSNSPQGKNLTSPYLIGFLLREFCSTGKLYSLGELLEMRRHYNV